MTYKFQDMGKLMHIDVLLQLLEKNKPNHTLGIAQKINNDSFKLQFSSNNVRPKTFDKNETVVFTQLSNYFFRL